MTEKGKAKDKAAKAKFAQIFPDLMRKIATTTGAEEQVDQIGATADAIFAPHAPSE